MKRRFAAYTPITSRPTVSTSESLPRWGDYLATTSRPLSLVQITLGVGKVRRFLILEQLVERFEVAADVDQGLARCHTGRLN